MPKPLCQHRFEMALLALYSALIKPYENLTYAIDDRCPNPAFNRKPGRRGR
jgi:hypothetical protein